MSAAEWASLILGGIALATAIGAWIAMDRGFRKKHEADLIWYDKLCVAIFNAVNTTNNVNDNV